MIVTPKPTPTTAQSVYMVRPTSVASHSQKELFLSAAAFNWLYGAYQVVEEVDGSR
jgi:hypothetical protein